MRCEAVILAAGLGTRMESDLPKVLHLLAGRPLLQWSVDACSSATGGVPTVIIGPEVETDQLKLGTEVRFVQQVDRLGTGHAALQARDALRGKADLVLVVNADLPLIRENTLQRLVQAQKGHSGPLTLLTSHAEVSRGFGRIQRMPDGRIEAIVEEAHASPDQLAVMELNVGAYCYRAEWLWDHLPQLPLSPKGEYYLTDLVSLAVGEGEKVGSVEIEDQDEIIGVNTRAHLAQAEAAMRVRINRRWMLAGVTMVDPATTYIGPDVTLGKDTILLPNTHLEGATSVGSGCRLGPNSILRDTSVGDRCQVEVSVLEGAILEDEVEVGPFAHLRSGARLCRGVHLGNFGEVKNSTLKPGVKMGHFSYIGDAVIGENVNIGAGTITCNYDGEQKYQTEIGDEAFIGSDTMLVAPLRIGRGARTGAGSVVTRDVPDHSMAVGVPARVIRKLNEGK